MAKHGSMTKSPVALAKQAMKIAKKALTPYSAKRSRHDFTQAQLFAILILRQFFQTDYRGIVQLLEDLTDLKKVLGLTKVPHFTTLQKAQQRLVKKGLGTICSPQFSLMPELAN
jgi:argininosuccinate lyase